MKIERNTTAKIYVTPLMRAVWHEMIAADKELPNPATRIAVLLGRHFNNNTAETFVAQTTLAAESGVSKRLVWNCLKAMRDRGHLIVRHGGRRSNYYGMPFEKVAAECELRNRKKHEKVAAECDIKLRQSSQFPTEKVAAECERSLLATQVINNSSPARATRHHQPAWMERRDRRHEAVHGSNWQTRRDAKHDALDELRAFNERIRQEDGGGGVVSAMPSDELGQKWSAIKNRLVESGRLDEPKVQAWLDPIWITEVDGDALTLIAPTKFIAKYVTENFEAAILAVCAGEGLEVARVVVVVHERIARPAPQQPARAENPAECGIKVADAAEPSDESGDPRIAFLNQMRSAR